MPSTPRRNRRLSRPGREYFEKRALLRRIRDRRALGGWRYQAHLTILGPGWVGGVDGNVSNIAVASIERDTPQPTVLAGRVHNIPVTRETAQHEGPVRSTIHHNPTTIGR